MSEAERDLVAEARAMAGRLATGLGYDVGRIDVANLLNDLVTACEQYRSIADQLAGRLAEAEAEIERMKATDSRGCA